MDATRSRPRPDPDFDRTPEPRVRLRDFNPADQHRLVVNPFLAAASVFWFGAALVALGGSSLPTLATTVLAMVTIPILVQFHCLDCGRTGPYARRRRHACRPVMDRHGAGESPGFPAISPRVQLLFWVYTLGALGLLYAVFRLTSLDD